MKLSVKVIGSLSILALVLVYGNYGAITPCGILKQKFHRQLTNEMLSDSSSRTDMWSAAGAGIGMALAGPAIDNMVAGLSPWECMNAIGYMNGWVDHWPLQSKTPISQTVSPPPPPPLPSWQVYQAQSKLSDQTTDVMLSLDGNEQLKGGLDEPAVPTLTFRCFEGKTDAYIDLKTQPKTEYEDGNEYVEVTLRFDKDRAKKYKMGLDKSRNAVFFREGGMPIIKTALQRNTLVMQLTLYQSGIQTVTFNLQDLTQNIAPLQKACRWK